MMYFYESCSTGLEIAKRLGIEACWPYTNKRMSYGTAQLPMDINWGCVKIVFDADQVLNPDLSVCKSKPETFERFDMYGIPHPPCYKTPEEAINNGPYMARKDGKHSGLGIRLCFEYSPAEEGETFFTTILPRKDEYRVHIVRDRAIAYQRKVYRGYGETYVLSHRVGAVYNWCNPIPEIEELAVASIEASGLNFGAVDMFLDVYDQWHVLEVNSAPGLRTDRLVLAYVEAFK